MSAEPGSIPAQLPLRVSTRVHFLYVTERRHARTIRTAQDLGLLIRERRRALKWTQGQLGERIGATRQGVAALEHGKPRTEIGLMMGALNALGLMDQAVEPFLDLLGRDIDEHPERVQGFPPALLARIKRLTVGVTINHDAPIDGHVQMDPPVSRRTVHDMDAAMDHLSSGKAGAPVDGAAMLAALDQRKR